MDYYQSMKPISIKLNIMKHKTPRASHKIHVWLSYDMGSAGYNDLYSWLKGRNATECGNSIAYFLFERNHGQRIVPALRREIEQAINIAPDTRMFLIYKVGATFKCIWLYGSPKANAPWDNANPYIVP